MIISMFRGVVLELLEKHRKEHLEEYQKQLEGWRKQHKAYTDSLSEWANSDIAKNKKPKEPEKPQSFEHEYDEMIEMVTEHRDTKIQLDERDFEKIVRNKFGWGGYFYGNTATYSSFVED